MNILEIDGSLHKNLNIDGLTSLTSLDLDRVLNRKVITCINTARNKLSNGHVITCDPLMLDILFTSSSFIFPQVSTSVVVAGKLMGDDIYLDRSMDPYTALVSSSQEYIIKCKIEGVLEGQNVPVFEYLIKIVNM